MAFIPGWLMALITFPGVIVHEIAHRLFCDLAEVPVYEVCYFRIGNPAGYVVHGEVRGLRNSFLISIGPLIINTILCILLTFSAVFPIFFLEASESNGVFTLLAWIGYSIGMHAFPSNEDVDNFLVEVRKIKKTKKVLYFLCKSFTVLLKIASALKVVWFDVIYAVAISMILPLTLLLFL